MGEEEPRQIASGIRAFYATKEVKACRKTMQEKQDHAIPDPK